MGKKPTIYLLAESGQKKACRTRLQAFDIRFCRFDKDIRFAARLFFGAFVFLFKKSYIVLIKYDLLDAFSCR